MRCFIMVSALILFSLTSSATTQIVKTYDGHRAVCHSSQDVLEISQQKAIRVSFLGEHQVQVQVLKCTFDGWVQDENPGQERVDQSYFVNYPIYQNYHEYRLYIVNQTQQVIQSSVLGDLPSFGRAILDVQDWEHSDEIFVSALVSKTDEAGHLLDEKHEESFGSFRILK